MKIFYNKGEGLELKKNLIYNGLSLPVVPKQTVIEYFIQDQITTKI